LAASQPETAKGGLAESTHPKEGRESGWAIDNPKHIEIGYIEQASLATHATLQGKFALK